MSQNVRSCPYAYLQFATLRPEAVDGQDTYGLRKISRRPNIFGEQNQHHSRWLPIHSFHPTWCGLWIQVIDATFSKSFHYFCCKNGILLDICFSEA
ncbi:hypothetical protein AVEN_74567-1 [Araneus ventricosus]|uniref:Uncharacterized protein n=1 Tax=Araneus ventricosus TaxID=182803 RepID=A0A4Y2TP02_ARAVE|nr:hypothetical protein AVEN_74567-1 [Araneus ventricosus]